VARESQQATVALDGAARDQIVDYRREQRCAHALGQRSREIPFADAGPIRRCRVTFSQRRHDRFA